MKLKNYSAGKEIVCYCSKCQLNLAHIIVSMLDISTINRVQCKTCKSSHKFKDPSRKKPKTSTSKIIKKFTNKTSTESNEITWSQLVNRPANEIKKYSIKAAFQKGDVIDHIKFGLGHIENSVDNDKINVLFRDGTKILIHNK